ncbi:MAG: aspartate carbamoyltransferase catalytic subunit [Parcubacteria group bacterium Gr01-1014_70]|nr:MAG: aspartate carbamoyltransferase catalytic subunit [Parcubacteria group bacterium Gr01-1014_70]
MAIVNATNQFDLPFLIHFTRTVKEIKDTAEKDVGGVSLLTEVLRGKMIGKFFWPPSSRTFHQFSVAGQKLGAGGDSERGLRKEVVENGKKRTIWELPFSSELKDAFFEDEVYAWASAYDILVLRHFEEGHVARAARYLDSFEKSTHVINAGDGKGQHPSQALIDLLTILIRFNVDLERTRDRLRDLTIAFIGDNRTARTVHSNAPLLGMLGMKIKFISLPELSYPVNRLAELDALNVRYEFRDTLDHADIFYVTRPHFVDYDDYGPEESERIIGEYMARFAITQEVLLRHYPQLVIDPFPRSKRGEIPIWLPDVPSTHQVSIDRMPQAGYYQQMDYGVLARMAILKMIAAPHVRLKDLYDARWKSSYTRQCICGRVDNSVFGWSENPQPPHLFLPKVVECSFCKI